MRYWAMRPVGGEAVPDTEVDELRWLSLDDAAAQLTRDNDRDVIAALRERL